MRIVWPIRLKSQNDAIRIGGAIAYRSKKKIKDQATVEVANAIHNRGAPPGPPWVVTLTRHSVQALDDDNLVAAFKHIRDGVARALGVDDNDKSKISWKYDEKTVGEYAVVIDIRKRR